MKLFWVLNVSFKFQLPFCCGNLFLVDLFLYRLYLTDAISNYFSKIFSFYFCTKIFIQRLIWILMQSWWKMFNLLKSSTIFEFTVWIRLVMQPNPLGPAIISLTWCCGYIYSDIKLFKIEIYIVNFVFKFCTSNFKHIYYLSWSY